MYPTFNLGGSTKYFIEVETIHEIMEAFSYAKKNEEEVFVLGGGSNLIVSDKGYNRIILKINAKRFFNEDYRIKVETGMDLSQLIKICIGRGFAGIDRMMGIPGTIGGTIRGNAGAYG